MQLANPVTNRNYTFSGTGLAAARVGAVATGVLLFTAAPLAGGNLSISNTADDGTVVEIIKRGIYKVTLAAVVPASGAGAFGISLNAAPADLLAASNPINTAADILQGQHAIAPAATQIPISLSATIAVTDAMAGGGGAIVRFRASNGSGVALPAGGVIAAQVKYRFARVSDCQG